MRAWFRKWWPVIKALLAVAILGGVGWQFASILRKPELWQRPLRPHAGWLVLSAVLYVAGLGFPCFFWYRLLRVTGERPPVLGVVRAYFVAHLGKYVPGKAWAVLVRTGLAREAGVRVGTAAL